MVCDHAVIMRLFLQGMVLKANLGYQGSLNRFLYFHMNFIY